MTVYKYTDNSWVDGSEDCPCCSGLTFESYNAVGWEQNGSASSLWELHIDALVACKAKDYKEEVIEFGYYSHELYEGFNLQELKTLCERLGIVLEEVSVE